MFRLLLTLALCLALMPKAHAQTGERRAQVVGDGVRKGLEFAVGGLQLGSAHPHPGLQLPVEVALGLLGFLAGLQLGIEAVKLLLHSLDRDLRKDRRRLGHGGADLDRRLAELAEDRRVDNLGRKDARSKQAGVRFARRFVIAVPFGMAVAGMSLGDGRAAYQTPGGQLLVAVGLALVAACWAWSGSMLRLPQQNRVFD